MAKKRIGLGVIIAIAIGILFLMSRQKAGAQSGGRLGITTLPDGTKVVGIGRMPGFDKAKRFDKITGRSGIQTDAPILNLASNSFAFNQLFRIKNPDRFSAKEIQRAKDALVKFRERQALSRR